MVHNLRRSVVRSRILVAEYYMRYSTFWPDFLAALPLVAEVCTAQPRRHKLPYSARKGTTMCIQLAMLPCCGRGLLPACASTAVAGASFAGAARAFACA